MSNDISIGCQNKCQMILVQMYNIFRKQKNVENDGHLNKQQL